VRSFSYPQKLLLSLYPSRAYYTYASVFTEWNDIVIAVYHLIFQFKNVLNLIMHPSTIILTGGTVFQCMNMLWLVVLVLCWWTFSLCFVSSGSLPSLTRICITLPLTVYQTKSVCTFLLVMPLPRQLFRQDIFITLHHNSNPDHMTSHPPPPHTILVAFPSIHNVYLHCVFGFSSPHSES
jgi:hypothetical protein